MQIIAVAIWLAMAIALYAGLRARLMPHQPAWQALAIVVAVAGLIALAAISSAMLAQRPNYGVEDGGGAPEHPGVL